MSEETKKNVEQDLDLEQFGAGKKIKKGLVILAVAVAVVLAAVAVRMLVAGFSFKSDMAKYDSATLIVLKDPNDPSKQCRCLEMREGLGYLTTRIGMSIVSEGPKQECGHDAMITFGNSSEQYSLTLSTRCGYIKYPPTAEFPTGESRNYSKWLVGSYVEDSRENGVDCDCID
ncbi:MAG TPA: hypothetical protein PLV42_04055 [bacterium]|nr:hypothetical protein [bacterium]